jgi:hypothetical protein
MWRAFLCLPLLCAACGDSGSSSSEETFKFRDTKGRQCTTKRFPPTATCDSPPAPSKGCGVGSAACFIVGVGQLERNDAGLTGPAYVRNCDSCCTQGASSNILADCVPVVCTTSIDCAGENADCISGQCVAKR